MRTGTTSRRAWSLRAKRRTPRLPHCECVDSVEKAVPLALALAPIVHSSVTTCGSGLHTWKRKITTYAFHSRLEVVPTRWQIELDIHLRVRALPPQRGASMSNARLSTLWSFCIAKEHCPPSMSRGVASYSLVCYSRRELLFFAASWGFAVVFEAVQESILT